jgi:hypothetical protein
MPKPEKEITACQDCRWYQCRVRALVPHRCTAQTDLDVITGTRVMVTADARLMRANPNSCGLSARWFAPREVPRV